ncbi:MAG: hypothetical protein V1827_01355 [Candidatus Micrarchaeota archaeon]
MKAQATFEFMVVYTVLLLIFLIVFSIFSGGSLNLYQAQDTIAAGRDAQALAAAVNYVYLAGDGASYRLSMRKLAAGENLTFSDFSVSAEMPRAYASAPILTADVEAGEFNESGIMIENSGGGIDVH